MLNLPIDLLQISKPSGFSFKPFLLLWQHTLLLHLNAFCDTCLMIFVVMAGHILVADVGMEGAVVPMVYDLNCLLQVLLFVLTTWDKL